MKRTTANYFFYCAMLAMASASALQAGQREGGQHNVTVMNGAGNPVPVRIQSANPVPTTSTDNPAFQPYEQSASLNGASDSYDIGHYFTIPANKRLVVELITYRIALPHGQVVTSAFANGHVLSGAATMVPQNSDVDFCSITQAAKFYAGSGTPNANVYNNNVFVTVERNQASGGWDAYVSISGYLVDLPQ